MEIQKAVVSNQYRIIPQLASEIWYECFQDIISKAQIDYMLDKFLSEEAIKKQISDDGYEFFIISDNKRIVGFTAIKKEEDRLFLSKLYVRKDERRKGYATGVINYLAEICKENNLGSIYLTVNKNNSRAIKAYKACGFEIEKELCADIGGGFVMDDYVMVKTI